MITLNLIPESIREENRLKNVFWLNVRLGMIIIYISVIVATLIQIARYTLADNYQSIHAQADLVIKNSQAYNARTKELNERIKVLTEVTKSGHDWNDLIMKIANLLPNGVTLSLLSVNQETQAIRLVGVASTRDDLLKLKANIGESKYLEDVKLPMSSILEKENIAFDINSKLDVTKLPNHK